MNQVEIYSKTNTNYSKNGDITLTPISCTYKESEYLVTLEHPLDDLRSNYIDYENVIKIEGQLYRIYNVVKSLDIITAYARPLFFDLTDTILLDTRPTLKTGKEALDTLLADTDFIGHSDISTVSTSYYVRKNIVEAILGDDENSFLNRWGGELLIDNFDIYINNKIGTDKGVRVEFGYNLSEIEEDVNIEEVATRLIPVGYNEIMLEGNSPWVDSPLINNYTRPKMKIVKFDDVKVKEKADDEEGFATIEEARAELINRCRQLYAEGIDKPKINYKIDMVNLANTTAYKDYANLVKVEKGDTVTCYIPSLSIDVKARVIDFEKDLLTGEYISIELGNSINNFFQTQADITRKVNNAIDSNGNVIGEQVKGLIDSSKAMIKAQKNVAETQDIIAMLFEDLNPTSATYGAMCLGTMGFMISNTRTADNKDWIWTTIGTPKGFIADSIIAGILSSKDGTSYWNLDDGVFSTTGYDESNRQGTINIGHGKIDMTGWNYITSDTGIEIGGGGRITNNASLTLYKNDNGGTMATLHATRGVTISCNKGTSIIELSDDGTVRINGVNVTETTTNLENALLSTTGVI